MRSPMPLALEVKGGADAAHVECRREVARPFEDEHVMPITRVRISLRQRVIDEHRQAKMCSERERHIEGRILPRTNGRPGPIEYELA